ncbi:ribosomal RNA processing protein 36 homolog [Babylonia areolata]|uniref:ribosomal RNA processing protein 36 homolog n=1 Tax=Babylonia areolata TaxID=304850 RepID=UPI003FD1AF8A
MVSRSTDGTLAKLREELADLTAEEMQSLKEKMGLKAFRRVFDHIEEAKVKKGPQPRANKNRPLEVSSKHRHDPLSKLPQMKKRVVRDPRFDDISGTFREDIFDRDYSFIKDLKAEEKKKVKKQLKKEKNEEKKQKLKQILNRMAQEEQTKESKQNKKKLLQEWKEKERERVKEGKTPYFLKKSDMRKLELADKFRSLKEKGQVARQIEKKRRRNAAKQKKKGMLD